jgi:HEAT repeat protein
MLILLLALASTPPPDALTLLRSPSVLRQNEGVAGLIAAGSVVTPRLVAALSEPGLPRAQVMFALSRVGDSRALDAFTRGLDDPDERVRAFAAGGLTRLHAPNALAANLRTLDDAADPLHADHTPAVEALGEMGLVPVEPLLGVFLESERRDTRLHAARAIEGVVSRRHGFRPGGGFPSRERDEACRGVLQQNGPLDFELPRAMREPLVTKWRGWLREQR